MDCNKLRLNKIFVGGLPLETSEDELRNHFLKYGQIIDLVIIKDKQSKKSRGFGFVTFKEQSSMENTIKDKQRLREKSLDIKIAEPKKNGPNEETADVSHISKLFIGGIPKEVTQLIFKEHFLKYGAISDIVLIEDKKTNEPRGFGFVTYTDPESAKKAMDDYTNHCLLGKWVECKFAMPRSLTEEDYEQNAQDKQKVRDNNCKEKSKKAIGIGRQTQLDEKYYESGYGSQMGPNYSQQDLATLGYLDQDPHIYSGSNLPPIGQYTPYPSPYVYAQSQPYYGDPLYSPEQQTRTINMTPVSRTLGAYTLPQYFGSGVQGQPDLGHPNTFYAYQEPSYGAPYQSSAHHRKPGNARVVSNQQLSMRPAQTHYAAQPLAPTLEIHSPHSSKQRSHHFNFNHVDERSPSHCDLLSPMSSAMSRISSHRKGGEGFTLLSEKQQTKSKSNSTTLEREVIISKKRGRGRQQKKSTAKNPPVENEINEEGSCLASDDDKLKSLSNNDSQKVSNRDIKAEEKGVQEKCQISKLNQVSLSSMVLIGFKAPSTSSSAQMGTTPILASQDKQS